MTSSWPFYEFSVQIENMCCQLYIINLQNDITLSNNIPSS